MFEELEKQREKYKISKVKIRSYKRFNKNYLFSLPIKKQIYYIIGFICPKLILLS